MGKTVSNYGKQGKEEDWFSSTDLNIRINGTESDYLEISSDIPQGSILGPILFLVYVNDPPFISKFIGLVLNAGDMDYISINN